MRIIETQELTLRFGPLIAVAGVNLDVRAGDIHAIIGPNGAGKTTLLNLIAGSLRPTSGSIRFCGQDITRLPIHRRAMLGISRSFQIVKLFSGLTCQQVMQLADQRDKSAIHWLSEKHSKLIAQHALSLLRNAGLDDYADVETTNLSHGLQKHFEIALALANKSRVLLLDEPMAGMNVGERGDLVRTMRRLAGEQTIVFVEHDIETVMSVATRISLMHNGQLIVDGSPAEVRNNTLARTIYLGAAGSA